MADNRINALPDTLSSSQLQSLLASLYLAVDAVSLSDAHKLAINLLLSEAIVSANTNNYQAMTPKAFYDSIMTPTRKGIGQLSTDSDVTDKTGTGLLNSIHQTLMQTQWFKDWFISNGPPSYYQADAEGSSMNAISFNANWNTELDINVPYVFSPTLPTGKVYNSVYYRICIRTDMYNSAVASSNLVYSGFETTQFIGGVPILLIGLAADGRSIFFKKTAGGTETVLGSVQCNCILQ